MKQLSEIDLESLPEKTIDVFTLRESVKRGVKLNTKPWEILSGHQYKGILFQDQYDNLIEEHTDNIMIVIINELFL